MLSYKGKKKDIVVDKGGVSLKIKDEEEIFEIADSYETLYNKNAQQAGGVGSFVYDNGVLTMNADSDEDYSVTFTPDATFNPAELANLLMDVSATVPFNVTMTVTTDGGDATMEYRNEFFDVFGLETAPAAIPAGDYNAVMSLYGYYQWNGGVPATSTIKSVTVTLTEKGTLTMSALQVSRNSAITYVQDGEYNSGSLSAEPDNKLMGDVNGDGQLSTQDVRLIMSATVGSDGVLTDEQLAVADYNGDGVVNTQDARAILMGLTQ